MELSAGQRGMVMDTARRAIRAALRGDHPPPLDRSDPALWTPCGCFVTLHEAATHRLRGCIGTFDARQPLLDAVQRVAVGALEDARFIDNRIIEDDLPALELDISILSPLRPMSGPMDFDPFNEGIHMTFGNRTGCYLPQVARETGWTREQLLDRLCIEKMGLSPLVWRNPHSKFHAFATTIIGPEPFAPRSGT